MENKIISLSPPNLQSKNKIGVIGTVAMTMLAA